MARRNRSTIRQWRYFGEYRSGIAWEHQTNGVVDAGSLVMAYRHAAERVAFHVGVRCANLRQEVDPHAEYRITVWQRKDD